MASSTLNFYSKTDHMTMLVALLKMYNMDPTDISAIRTIGFNIHMLTNINDTVLFKANSAITESSPITATKYSSLLKHAAEVGVTPTYAYPSSVKLSFIISEDDFIAKATKSGDIRSYTISKLNNVFIGSFVYSLDYDIEIRLESGSDNKYYLTARYVADSEVNSISQLENLTIPCVRMKTERGWDYYLFLELKQYMREIKEVEFTNRDYQLIPISLSRGTDEIAGFDVYYRNTNSLGLITTKLLKQKIFFENSRTSEDSIFVHWDSINSFTLVHKSQDSGFRPQIGDKILVYCYVTTGARANYTYMESTGSNIKFNQKDSSEITVRVELEGDNISSGGISSDVGIETLRKEIITKKSTYDAIIIENDLKMQLNKRKSGNEYAVIKYRNDIQKIFNIFTTLRFMSDGNSCLIPTNTLDIEWKYREHGESTDTTDNFYIMTEKNVISEEVNKGKIIPFSQYNTYPNGTPLYWLPFIISYSKEHNMIRLYDPSIEKTFRTNYELLNEKVPYSWMCNWVNFFKEDFDKPFMLTFELRHNLVRTAPNETLFTVDDNHPGEIFDTGFVKVYFTLINKKGETVYRERCKMMSYKEVKSDDDDDYFTFQLELIPKNYVTKIQDDKMLLNPDHLSGGTWVDVEDLTGNIEVEMPTTKDPITRLLTNDVALINRFSFDCWLSKNRTKDHKLQHSVVDNDTIKLFQVPLVEYSFYKNFKHKYIEALANEYKIDEYLSKFQGEFSYSLKYANSYGLSNSYNIGLKDTLLNNVMIELSFIIELKMGATVTEKQLNTMVHTYINSINFLNYDELHINNLIKFLKDNFPNDIEFIQFKDINNLGFKDQLISMNISAITNKTVIEKLNLPLVYYADTNTFGFKVNWEYR